MALQPYLFFEGRTEEALEFYKKALGADKFGLGWMIIAGQKGPQ